MSALQALQGYESSSSESEELNLDDVDNHSKSENAVQDQKDGKRPALPSVPSEILGMFDTSSHVAEGNSNASSHGGRIRSFEHVAGNWATLVYIPVELTEQLKIIMEDLLSMMPSSVDMEPVPDLHISLSRTVTLQYQWIDPFVDSIRQRLASFGGFTYCFDNIEFYANDEKTRSFIGLKANHGHQEMLNLVKIIDVCLQEFSLPVYYEKPSFHVSFGWCLGDYQTFLGASDMPRIQRECRKLCRASLPLSVSEIWCKVGCKQFRIPLGMGR
ncbi:U6 snRNA phosphodiesterase-like [Asterias rubens]|uniref:U6 snRNA phosphodiesterase-like n=1 Tax=Asterias rubens TaxID=7604 RepID=UPI001455C54F|nr:U6 snRNA phosphodiesterase-like [Asterias rubens]XP_033625831.1 U6 snRNA phosphodiesterase-like [Asterias rubens]XP_033625832.1 U6 snRNA phosphodiesterase-like [Asterias rubens]XP_033625833.1 U6 snRNA phosphodiesterase-like [Asterias rubens]